MAIKAGQIVHVGNGAAIVKRLQTAGPGTLNVPVETIYELGNYKSVGQVRDIPDLSFSMESYDVSSEMEALLLGLDPTSVAPTDLLDPSNARPMDFKTAFKQGKGTAAPFDTIDSAGIPFLTLESLEYRFGLTDDARQTATLRGDSVYYNPGTTYVESTAGSGVAGQTVVSAHPAYGVEEGGVFRRLLNVTAGSKRLLYGVDYTEAYGTVTAGAATTTITLVNPVAVTDDVRIMYSSPTVESIPQSANVPASATAPAAIRGRDIAVYLGGYDSGNPFTNRLLGVQSATATWRVTLQKDQEFGNYHLVSQDYDVPSVTGSIGVRPVDPAAMLALMQKLGGVTDAHRSASATAAPVIPLDIVLHSPVDGSVLKHIAVDDARFTIPGFSARVQQKLDFTINFTSDQGDMVISGQ